MASGYSDLSEIRKNDAYARYHRPAKINLINERPRRESLIEQQLATTLTRPDPQVHFEQPEPASWLGASKFQPMTSLPEQGSRTAATTTITLTASRPSSGAQPSVAGGGAPTSSMFDPITSSRADQGYGQTSAVRDQFAELENDLMQREARIKREMAHLNQKLSPWARPRQIREPRREPEPRNTRGQQRWIKECPSSPHSSRPTSRASSTRSNTEAELMDKASKLIQTAEELERKPMKKQMILIESGARRAMESPSQAASSSSIHTAVIKKPNYEVDNKSPLPVAFDNFSTLGVRGNLASIGAAPPETPYAPIFPLVKRTPSPMDQGGRKF